MVIDPLLDPLVPLAEVRLIAPHVAELVGLASSSEVRQREIEVLRKLSEARDCTFIFPENPVDLHPQASAWTRLDSVHWQVGALADLHEAYRDIFCLGGWLAIVGGRLLKRIAIEGVAVHTPEGLRNIRDQAEARMVIFSFEDDLRWLVAFGSTAE
ncbi:MAG: hypothetical protein BroJett010_25580 [Gammaproteobacteria bacterium]|nr:MAG: hypothetical protein BroJett010_25580 [Gammaproteobacteria bacterium]